LGTRLKTIQVTTIAVNHLTGSWEQTTGCHSKRIQVFSISKQIQNEPQGNWKKTERDRNNMKKNVKIHKAVFIEKKPHNPKNFFPRNE
jgi:hypothetical protein